MLRKDIFWVVFVTCYLFVYCILLQFDATFVYAVRMLIFSPLLLCWLVFMILKYGIYKGPELGEDEFGYQDKKQEELGIF